ncbi:unnamed protein product [Paramecium sonneborni]|uniref:Major facilitator superfamily protein n=1 Tax=Paramecium sonneborni TaxID=65129 RepID=A0A8S1Q5K7_9CILI|nr:unnamed protein product [Paramecium sonneborni]
MFNSPVPGLKAKRIQVFICCFIQYVMLHSCCSTWSFTSGILAKQDDDHHKYDDQKIDDFDKSYFADVNFAFLFTYGSSMLFLGQVGDRIGPKRFMLCGTFLTGIIQFLIAGLFTVEQHNRWIILTLMIFNGLAQALVWPGLMAIMNNWQSKPNQTKSLQWDISPYLFFGIFIEQFQFNIISPIYVASAGVKLMSFINIFPMTTDTAKEHISKFRNTNTKSLVYKDVPAEYMSRTGSRTACVVSNQYLDIQNATSINLSQLLLKILLENYNCNRNDQRRIALIFSLHGNYLICIKAVFYQLEFRLPNYLRGQELNEVVWIKQMIECGNIQECIFIQF